MYHKFHNMLLNLWRREEELSLTEQSCSHLHVLFDGYRFEK